MLLIGIFMRFSLLDTLYEIDDGDVARDYMIARHIVKYSEYPLIGPNNAVYDAVRASPLYYYLLAVPVAIHDNVHNIGVFNIILQAISMVFVYGIALLLFGQSTALVTAVLLLLNQELFSQSFYMIQAHFGHVFFNGSYLFLTYSYLHKSRLSLYASVIFFALGCIVSFHGFPALIGYLIILYFVTRSQKASIPQMLSLYGSMLLLGMIFYTPMLHAMLISRNAWFLVQDPVYIQSFTDLPIRIVSNIRLALNDWVTSLWLTSQTKNIFLGILCISLLRFLIWEKAKLTRAIIGILVAYLFQVGFLAALLRVQTNSYQYDSITGLTLIVLAFAATASWPKNLLGRIASTLSIIGLIFLIIPTSGYIEWQQSRTHQPQKLAPLMQYLDEQKIIHPTDWNKRFQIAMYNGHTNMYHWKESVIWNALEHRYELPFIRVVNYGYNYDPLAKNASHYILICEEYASIQDAARDCISAFAQDHEETTYIPQRISDESPHGYIIFSMQLKNTK